MTIAWQWRKQFGATHDDQQRRWQSRREKVKALTGGRGVDTAIEAVGVPATFELCEDLVDAGRRHRQYRRPWPQGGTASGTAVVAKHRHHHAAGGYGHHAHAARRRCSRARSIPTRLITHRFNWIANPGRLRHLWPRRGNQSAESHHRNLRAQATDLRGRSPSKPESTRHGLSESQSRNRQAFEEVRRVKRR